MPFQLDDNRVFVPVVLIGADGREHPTLAFLNPGFAGPALSNALYRQLGVAEASSHGGGSRPDLNRMVGFSS